ncbi:MAG: glycosyltransferase family 39 protein [Planctomycetes bacterium]|nr:glycosyltransferase family 39 protein [Planctomycetota bacterium]
MTELSLVSPDSKLRQERRQTLLVLLATLVVTAWMLAWTIGTQPIKGDEARHFRRAVNYYEAPWPDFRVTHDPAYPENERGAVLYWDTCLWHLVLALIWKIIGSASLLAAQLYHSAYFIVMAMAVYLAGRELYGHRGGLWAWAFIVTVPMNLLFGMLFYMEVPVMAWTAVAVYFLVRGNPIGLGLALGCMWLTKATSATVLIPPLLGVALLTMGECWPKRIARLVLAMFFVVVAVSWDCYWRHVYFGHIIMFRKAYLPLEALPPIVHHDVSQMAAPKETAVPLSIFRPMIVAQMFGITGMLAVLLAVVMAVDGMLRAIWENLRNLRSGLLAALVRVPDTYPLHALIFGVPLLVYLVGYAVMLKGSYDVRYLHPIVLFTSLMAAAWLVREPLAAVYRLHRYLGRLVVIGLIAAMAGQLLTVPPTVHPLRKLPPEVLDGFEWIRRNTDSEARFFYLEENLTTLTGRPIYWAVALPRYIFNREESRQMAVLNALKIDYIAIHPTRRDDGVGEKAEPKDYPRPWIRTLSERPYLELVYPPDFQGNPSADGTFLIYRILRDKIPEEWKKGALPPGVKPLTWQPARPSDGYAGGPCG